MVEKMAFVMACSMVEQSEISMECLKAALTVACSDFDSAELLVDVRVDA